MPLASCLNDACRHIALIDASKYADVEVPSFPPLTLIATSLDWGGHRSSNEAYLRYPDPGRVIGGEYVGGGGYGS
jgi:hypothetical protein